MSRQHPNSNQRTRQLRDIVLVPDKDDVKAVTLALQARNPKVSYERMRQEKPKWVHARVRRRIPPPAELHSSLKTFFEVALEDEELFTRTGKKAIASMLEVARLGYLSDPPELMMYYRLRKDREGLWVYETLRGTSQVEGGIHSWIRRNMPKGQMSAASMELWFFCYGFRHNSMVRESNAIL